MTRYRWQTAMLAAVLLLAIQCAIFATAARTARSPSIGYVYPAGGRQGATFEVTLAGRYLDGVNGVIVSGGDVQATLIEHVKPLNGKEINLLRDELKKMQAEMKKNQPAKPTPKAKAGQTRNRPAATPPANPARKLLQKDIAEIQTKLANPKNRNRENPQLGEDVKLKIVVSPDATPGRRELRIITATGLSNPVVFHVGRLPEYAEKEPNNETTDTNVDLPTPLVINGQIMPGDVDRFRIQAKKGNKLVMAAHARELIPYLADAVPGWFQATPPLYDIDGNEIAYDDDYRFDPDPVLFCEIPADGVYVVEIKDAIYRGREDFVYRITVGELPYVTSIFPMGGAAGTKTDIEIRGWNLPTSKLTLNAQDKEPGVIPISVRKQEMVSNDVPFALDTLPEETEREPNNRLPAALQIKMPLIINGRIDQPDDWDVFRFDGKAGDEVVAEINARRLGSPLDSIVKITDGSGKKLAINQDHEDRAAGLTTHHADSLLTFKLPEDGAYYVHVGDAQQKGGPEYTYRLRISKPIPDFELRIVPSGINARAGSTVALTAYALRKDGFGGKIAITLADAPPGFMLNPVSVGAEQQKVKLLIKMPPNPSKEPINLRLSGTATIEGRDVVHPAIPADDMMQAFINRHLVVAKDLTVSLIGRAPPARKTPTKKPMPKKKPTKTPATK